MSTPPITPQQALATVTAVEAARAKGLTILFVYGTLRPDATNLHILNARFGAVERLGHGIAVGCTLYDAGHFPAMTINDYGDASGRSVIGELIAVDAPALEQLDDYEGRQRLSGVEVGLYRPETIAVTVGANILMATTYLWNRPTTHMPIIDSGDWLDHMVTRLDDAEGE